MDRHDRSDGFYRASRLLSKRGSNRGNLARECRTSAARRNRKAWSRAAANGRAAFGHVQSRNGRGRDLSRLPESAQSRAHEGALRYLEHRLSDGPSEDSERGRMGADRGGGKKNTQTTSGRQTNR